MENEGAILGQAEGVTIGSDDSKQPKWKDGTPYTLEAVEGFNPNEYTPTEVIKRMQGLRKQLSELPGKTKAPEEYKINTEVFNIEDPVFKQYTQVAKEKNFTQEQFEAVLDVNKQQLENLTVQQKKAQEKYYQDEIAKLGSNAKQRFDKVVDWVSGLDLPDDVKKAFPNTLSSAAAIEAWESVIRKTPAYPEIPGRDHVATDVYSEDYTQDGLRKLMGDTFSKERERYNHDKSYQLTVKNYARKLAEKEARARGNLQSTWSSNLNSEMQQQHANQKQQTKQNNNSPYAEYNSRLNAELLGKI